MTSLPLPTDLESDLERIARIIEDRVAPRQVVAGIAARHLGDASGRLHAAVALLAARAGAYQIERAEHAAASVALIYAATRVHDELVDAGDRRRGAVESQPRLGSSATLMVGDYLFALAASEMALAPDPRIISYYSRSVMAICEAQMMPVTLLAPLADARAQALQYARAASAALLESAAGAGAVCGALSQPEVEALARYGADLGIAIHLARDARDCAGEGRALLDGVITLPLIYAAGAGAHVSPELLSRRLSGVEHRALLDEIRRTGGVERTEAEARDFARSAAKHLRVLGAGAARDALVALAEAAGQPSVGQQL
jgi:heptaprenyl diphosphate synthase